MTDRREVKGRVTAMTSIDEYRAVYTVYCTENKSGWATPLPKGTQAVIRHAEDDAALLAERDQLREATGWLPIETAPGDDTPILIATKRGRVGVVTKSGDGLWWGHHATFGAHHAEDIRGWMPLPAHLATSRPRKAMQQNELRGSRPRTLNETQIERWGMKETTTLRGFMDPASRTEASGFRMRSHDEFRAVYRAKKRGRIPVIIRHAKQDAQLIQVIRDLAAELEYETDTHFPDGEESEDPDLVRNYQSEMTTVWRARDLIEEEP